MCEIPSNICMQTVFRNLDYVNEIHEYLILSSELIIEITTTHYAKRALCF
jgi:hypothetical protein